MMDEIYLKNRRHGDLRGKKIDKIPFGAKKLGGDILAHGENGHEHKFVGNVQMYASPTGQQVKYFEALEESKLVHEEHNTIPIEKGYYELVHEREFSPADEMTRQVID
jgi:hypothetical protein